MIENNDQTEELAQAVQQAIESGAALQIIGGGSKSFYGRLPQGRPLKTTAHQGIVNYHPSELVITARTGVLLADIEQILAEHGQMLAFEPPYFKPTATLGGSIACGFSGPGRPFYGAARDFVLGCKMINGKAEVLSFGGEVMKNVAGYDVSRLMVGALGTLGVLLEVSLKVLPKPEVEHTLAFELNFNKALSEMSRLAKQSLPLSAMSYDGSLMYLRLSGVESAVNAARKKLGGNSLQDGAAFWESCKEQKHAFFQEEDDLWRLSLPPATAVLDLPGEYFYEWGGAQRWLKTGADKQTIFELVASLQGHAFLFRAQDRSADIFQPMTGTLQKLHHNVKKAFDPHGIFNPYRMNKDW